MTAENPNFGKPSSDLSKLDFTQDVVHRRSQKRGGRTGIANVFAVIPDPNLPVTDASIAQLQALVTPIKKRGRK